MLLASSASAPLDCNRMSFDQGVRSRFETLLSRMLGRLAKVRSQYLFVSQQLRAQSKRSRGAVEFHLGRAVQADLSVHLASRGVQD